jgi:hypothetical protein
MIRTALFGLALAALTPSSSYAATYTGVLNGVITSGSASYYQEEQEGPPISFTTDLAGTPITIKFQVDITSNYTDQLGNLIPYYVAIATETLVPALTGTVFGQNDIVSNQNNDPYNFFGGASFTGTAANGSLSSSGSFLGNEPDFYQTVAVSFNGAGPVQGALGGNGSVQTNAFDGRTTTDDYSVKFNLTNGYVVALGTPEPSTWALMILGFGMIGAGLRRRRTTLNYALS